MISIPLSEGNGDEVLSCKNEPISKLRAIHGSEESIDLSRHLTLHTTDGMSCKSPARYISRGDERHAAKLMATELWREKGNKPQKRKMATASKR